MVTSVKFLRLCIVSFLLLGSVAHAAEGSDTPETLIKDGKFFGEFRARYEHFEQDGISNSADAHTLRTNLGFKTGVYKDFYGLIEAQVVHHFGNEDFNSMDNGRTAYPAIPDPNIAQINQAYVSYAGLPSTEIKIGRQVINLNNQRFIGNAGWRQNEQTYDAATITNTSIDKLTLQYGYIGNVNRVFAGNTPPDDLNSVSHIANAAYAHADWLKLSGYGYWLDFDNAASLSSETFGLRATGQAPVSADWSLFYEVEAAFQQDHGHNTADYDDGYYLLAPGVKGHGFSFIAGYEVLGGDGSNAFQTPLGSMHKFNGWADKFTTTPSNGLKDLYLSASYQFSGTCDALNGTTLTAVYHDYDGDEDGDYGSEADFSIEKSFTLPDAGQPFKKIDVLLKYADYNGEDAAYTDTQKAWVQIGVKF